MNFRLYLEYIAYRLRTHHLCRFAVGPYRAVLQKNEPVRPHAGKVQIVRYRNHQKPLDAQIPKQPVQSGLMVQIKVLPINLKK